MGGIHIKEEERIICKCISKVLCKGKDALSMHDINITEVERIAEDQNIEALIYAAIGRNCTDNFIKKVIYSNLLMMKQEKMIGKVIKELNENNIKNIVLKGMYLRKYYPRPEFRTMGDIDILIQKKDLEATSSILLNLGYQKGTLSGYHIDFTRGESERLEIHYALINSNEFNDAKNILEKQLCEEERLTKFYIDKQETYTLNHTDLLIYLFIHIAIHKKNHGFGIRQLCDILLLVKNEKIDWTRVDEVLNKINLKRFSCAILVLIEKIFDIKINSEIKEKIPSKVISVLTQYIFVGGVHGNTDRTHMLATKQTKILEKTDNLEEEYYYAKKIKVLYPIAIIHRFIKKYTSSNLNFKDLIHYLVFDRRREKKFKYLDDWLFQ